MLTNCYLNLWKEKIHTMVKNRLSGMGMANSIRIRRAQPVDKP